jgi:hypothetical protein
MGQPGPDPIRAGRAGPCRAGDQGNTRAVRGRLRRHRRPMRARLGRLRYGSDPLFWTESAPIEKRFAKLG